MPDTITKIAVICFILKEYGEEFTTRTGSLDEFDVTNLKARNIDIDCIATGSVSQQWLGQMGREVVGAIGFSVGRTMVACDHRSLRVRCRFCRTDQSSG